MRPNELWTCPDDGAAGQGTNPWLSTQQLWFPSEEEEEGSGIASDVVKVEGEEPATPGDYLKSIDMRTL